MGERIALRSRFDGATLGAYRAGPADARRGGVVVIQEIFGVNSHIRRLVDGFAADGYEALAPSFYDRLQPGFEAGYDGPGVAAGRRLSEATAWASVAGDAQAAIEALSPPVFAVGYCWGGTATWLAACRCAGLAAASSYYGRRIPELMDETPRCPILLHFGRQDASIPMSVVDEIAERHPDIPIHIYDAGHGFACDDRADFREDAARLARLRTLQLFARAVPGGRGESSA
ncbi:MAG TPA: dienelactone hydrolase family protein [Caulobacteraceae bacterium]|nr:dienelactone hydrolase family protein [Caulobacteraceae bacterium]